MTENILLTPAAREALRMAHPPLVRAEAALHEAEEKLAGARAELQERVDECERLPARVARGEVGSAALDDAVRARHAAALRVGPAEVAVAEAADREAQAIEGALDAVATSIKERREQLRRDVPNAKVKDLPRFNAADWVLVQEADALRDVGGRQLLDGHDLGAPVTWERCLSDDLVIANANVAGRQGAINSAGGFAKVYR